MKFQAPKNENYAATVVALDKFVDLPNCDNVKGALVFGNHVIVAKNVEPGTVGLFFPVETQLLNDFLANNNLYRKPEWGNFDKTKSGFFEEHGRVKALKFRGHKSEGFWVPLSSLAYLGVGDIPVGTTFDCIGDRPICKKYIPRFQSRVGSGRTVQPRAARAEDRIVDGQFRFHPDTENLRRNVFKVKPSDIISISDKWHGTSAVFGNLLTKRDLKWWERVLCRMGVKVMTGEYGFIWTSRRVVKGVNEPKAGAAHYYSEDIWGVVAKEVMDRIPKGYSVYGEIVGYTTDGKPIQKGYHYGCQPGTHRFLVYRVTQTNADGKVIEFSWPQMTAFCERYGFEMVKTLWYGYARDFSTHTAEFETEAGWHSIFLADLEAEYVTDEMCPHNAFEVPAEGIVVRVDGPLDESPAFKLKNFKFLEWETKQLDKGEVDMETAETATEEEEAA